MKDDVQNPRFENLDSPPKEESLQVPGPYTRSPALMPRPVVAQNGAAPATVDLTINGKAVTVPAGTLLIEAANKPAEPPPITVTSKSYMILSPGYPLFSLSHVFIKHT